MFTRLPFGINYAPDYFSQWFSDLFCDLKNDIVHVDDILVYTRTKAEHKEMLKTIFSRIEKAGLTLNKAKCIFYAKEIEFLRHIVSESVKVHPKRISVILECAPPKDKHFHVVFGSSKLCE